MATEILYCEVWGYKPRAASLAASLDTRFGEKVQVKPGKAGQFDVVVDGKVIFSKGEVGRFPLDNEVEESFAKART